MDQKKKSRHALLITLLILFCLLLAGGIFAVLKLRSLRESIPDAGPETASDWLGTDSVLEVLAPDAVQHPPAHPPGMSSGAQGQASARSDGSSPAEPAEQAAGAAEQTAGQAPASLPAETDPGQGSAGAQAGQEETDAAAEGQTAGTAAGENPDQEAAGEENTLTEAQRAAFELFEQDLDTESVKITRKSLTKTQKKYVQSWEDFHGRTFPLNAPLHEYNWKYLEYDDRGFLQYKGDENFSVRYGIDVSEFQGSIDWKKVRKSGFDFAFIRAGYRMFDSGELRRDSKAIENLKAAKKEGLDVGIYVFSQAVSKKEAREEADLCLRVIKKSGVEITLPVVFDPEIQIDYYARINYISREQFTDNAVAFCERIRERGFIPAVYANSSTQTDILDMSRLTDTVLWNADYNMPPESPYRFTFWQYSDYGWLNGIPETSTDLNIWFIRNESASEEDAEKSEETAKKEAVKAEAAKDEAAKAETAKTGAAKDEASKAATAKTGAAKDEAAKAATAKDGKAEE